MTAKRAISGAFAGAALLAATAACSVSFNAGSSLDRADVEQTLAKVLEEETGTKPDKIECPGDLEGKLDTTMECTLTNDSAEYVVKLTVTKVDGLDVRFDYKVASTAKDGSTPEVAFAETMLEERVSSILEEEVGQRPDKIDCPGDLAGKVGETMRCTLSAGTDEIGLTVTVTEVEGTSMNFNVEVDES